MSKREGGSGGAQEVCVLGQGVRGREGRGGWDNRKVERRIGENRGGQGGKVRQGKGLSNQEGKGREDAPPEPLPTPLGGVLPTSWLKVIPSLSWCLWGRRSSSSSRRRPEALLKAPGPAPRQEGGVAMRLKAPGVRWLEPAGLIMAAASRCVMAQAHATLDSTNASASRPCWNSKHVVLPLCLRHQLVLLSTRYLDTPGPWQVTTSSLARGGSSQQPASRVIDSWCPHTQVSCGWWFPVVSHQGRLWSVVSSGLTPGQVAGS